MTTEPQYFSVRMAEAGQQLCPAFHKTRASLERVFRSRGLDSSLLATPVGTATNDQGATVEWSPLHPAGVDADGHPFFVPADCTPPGAPIFHFPTEVSNVGVWGTARSYRLYADWSAAGKAERKLRADLIKAALQPLSPGRRIEALATGDQRVHGKLEWQNGLPGVRLGRRWTAITDARSIFLLPSRKPVFDGAKEATLATATAQVRTAYEAMQASKTQDEALARGIRRARAATLPA